ncbi:unnamed protein product [Cylicocyclus nassatus]|uniref:Uncharacterized protein n=1 Tax=Cylicocyclus nassatus TaxID=53992 RepID=A0AA36GQV9_CYLNA|nr:unnamed protein product [Cylicocyclus nassatus]
MWILKGLVLAILLASASTTPPKEVEKSHGEHHHGSHGEQHHGSHGEQHHGSHGEQHHGKFHFRHGNRTIHREFAIGTDKLLPSAKLPK